MDRSATGDASIRQNLVSWGIKRFDGWNQRNIEFASRQIVREPTWQIKRYLGIW
jgi:hypothetical protein